MNNKKPVNLNLATIKQPPTAIVSILHRVSGFVVFLFIPFILWVLDASLSSPAEFANLQVVLTEPFIKFLVWVFVAGLLFHLIAGIRHLLMDLHLCENLASGRTSAYAVFIITAVLMILAGVWLW